MQSKTFTQSAIFVTFLTVLQKAFGLVREIILARYYGTTPIVDAFSMATSTSEIVLGCIVIFGIAFLPVYSVTVEKNGIEVGNEFMNCLLTVTVLIGLLVGSIAVVLAPQIISIVAPGFNGLTYTYTILFLRIGVWSMVMQAISATLASCLNYHEAYILSTVAGLVVSPVQIAVIIISVFTNQVLLGATLVISNVCYILLLSLMLRRYNYRYRPCVHGNGQMRHVWAIALPVFAGEIIAYANLTVDKIFGSQLESGSVSALNYAFNIRSLLVSIFTVVIGTMIYSILSKATARKDIAEIRDVTCAGVNLILIVFIPLTIGLVILAEPILSLLYSGGAFNERALYLTTEALIFYSIGLPAVALRNLLTRVFYSLQRTKCLVLAWMITMVVNVTGNYLLAPTLGVKGLALATSLSIIVALPVLYYSLRKALGGLHMINSFVIALKSFTASCIMGLLVKILCQFALSFISVGKVALSITLIAVICIGIGVYFALMQLFRVREVNDLLNALRKAIYSRSFN